VAVDELWLAIPLIQVDECLTSTEVSAGIGFVSIKVWISL
jgi:hypothetical protein